jgi:hypothetical protein
MALGVFLEVKQEGHKTGHFPHLVLNLTTSGALNLLPYTPLRHVQIRHPLTKPTLGHAHWHTLSMVAVNKPTLFS